MVVDIIEIAMKSLTFLGVLVSALVLMSGHGARRPFLLGLAGVALMMANAWTGAWGLLLDMGYLGAAGWHAWKTLAATRAPRTTFTVVG